MADSSNLPKVFSGYKLQSLEELKESLEMGMEVNFFMRGVWYLMEWEDDDHVFIAVCPDGEGNVYNSWDELFEKHMIDGEPIGNLWREFEIETM